ncbi:MAG: calcium-binding protein, partial [Nitriliruptorales bacterium]
YYGGDGSDLFFWEPGDGSDLIEGGAGEGDELRFVGNAGANRVEIFGGGGNFVNPFFPTVPGDASRAIVALNSVAFLTAAVFVDTADVEAVHVELLGGADELIVNNQVPNASTAGSFLQAGTDLAATHVRSITGDLGSGDGVADRVEIHGRLVADDIQIKPLGTDFVLGPVDVSGFDYSIDINDSIPGDLLVVRGQSGDDAIKAQDGLEARIDIRLDGDDGDDFLSADATLNGGAGDDFLEGGSGDDLLNGNAGEDTFVGGAGNDTIDGGADFDTILIEGTSDDDVIDVNQTAAATLVHTVNGDVQTDTLVLVAGVRTVESARVDAGAGDDVIRVLWADALGVDADVNSLRFDVDGGSAFTRDRLGVVDDGLGDLVIHRKGESDTTGSITVGPGNAEALLANFEAIEFIQPIVGAGGRLAVFKHDPFEFNDGRLIATHIGANEAVNVDPTIDPPAFNSPVFNLPADTDWFRIEALATGTLDFQVFFEEIGTLANGRPGLPGDGNLNILLFDADGTLIAGNGPAFGGNDGGGLNPELDVDGDVFAEDERIRIPAVQGQTYYLQVFGATDATINAYNMTIINTPAPVPFDLEVDDVIHVGTITAVTSATTFSGDAGLST